MPSRRVSAAELEAWQDFIRAASHILQRRPAGLFQEAANQPAAAVPARAAERRLAAGLERRPFLRQAHLAETPSPCRLTLAGHNRPITCCDLPPDGARIVSGSADGTLRLWDARTGRLLAELAGHGHGGIARCAFSPDGSLILSTVGEITDIAKRYPHMVGDISLWDGRTGSHIRSFPAQPQSLGAITACGFSPNGSRILAGGGEYSPGWLRVWDVATGRELLSVNGSNSLCTAGWSPDGSKALAGWSYQSNLQVLSTDDGRVLRTLDTGGSAPVGCAWSADGRWILCNTWGRFWVWEAESGRVAVEAEPIALKLADCAVTADGARSVSRSIEAVRTAVTLWETATGFPISWLGVDGVESMAAGFSPDGARVAVAYADGSVRLWDARGGDRLAELTGHGGSVRACAFSSDGSTLVSAADDNTLKVWDLAAASAGADAGPIGSPEGVLAPGPDGEFTTGTYDAESRQHVIRRWDADSGHLLCALRVSNQYEDCIGLSRLGYTGPGSSLRGWDFTADGRLCATWGSKRGWRPDLVIRDARTGEKLGELDGHEEVVTRGGFSPDGRLLVSSDELDLRVWDTATIALVGVLPGRAFLQFCHGGGRLLAMAGGHTLEVIDVAGLAPVAGVAEASWVHALSPDGSLLAVGHFWRKSLRVCSTVTGEVQVELAGPHGEHSGDCAFLPDGRHVATAGEGTVTIWELAGARALATYRGGPPLAFSPDGRWLACGGGRWLTLWDLPGAASACEYDAGGRVSSICWRADSRRLVVGGGAGRVLLLTLENVTSTNPAIPGGMP